jgi:hypothetical protein
VARVFLEQVYRHKGLPYTIVLDRARVRLLDSMNDCANPSLFSFIHDSGGRNPSEHACYWKSPNNLKSLNASVDVQVESKIDVPGFDRTAARIKDLRKE